MEPPDQIHEKEKKVKNLERELNDLRQGLAVVTDYYCDLERASKRREACAELDQAIIKPLIKEDLEVEGISSFYEEVLIADPAAHVPCTAMYDAFVRYCARTERRVVEQEAFEFVFARMGDPEPALDRGEWIGYQLRTETD